MDDNAITKIVGWTSKTMMEDLRAIAKEVDMQTRKECAEIARNACLVPPDGGSPTEEESLLCDRIAEHILSSNAKLTGAL